MAAGYPKLGNVTEALERIAARHAAIADLHRQQIERARQARDQAGDQQAPEPDRGART